MTRISHKRHCFPPPVNELTVWLYFRFTLSLRYVEEMLAQRGVDVRSLTSNTCCKCLPLVGR